MSRLFASSGPDFFTIATGVVVADPCTFACWFNSDNITGNQVLISAAIAGDPGWFRLMAAGLVAGDPIIADKRDLGTGENGVAETSTGFSADTWHHAAGVFTSDISRSAFIDGGSKVTDTTVVGDNPLDRTTIGVRADTLTNAPMNGRIAEAAIWNVALTDNEIAVLALGVLPNKVRPLALVGYWPLYALAGDAPDFTLNGNLMVETNGVAVANHAPVVPYSARFWGHGPLVEVVIGDVTMTADTGAYVITGIAADLPVGRSLDGGAVTGTYTIAGQAGTLSVAKIIEALQGTYVITGQAVALPVDKVVEAATGTYTLSGQDAGLDLGRGLDGGAVTGSYVISGQTADLLWAAVLDTTAGAYTISGKAAELKQGVVVAADAGVYLIDGKAANLLPPGVVLPADAGAYAISGQAAGLQVDATLPVDTGSYSINGQAANLVAGVVLALDTGSYLISGKAANLPLGVVLPTTTGSYLVTGNAASLITGLVVAGETGTYVITGNPAAVGQSLTITAETGSYTITGNAADLVVASIMAAVTGVYTITGNAATLTVALAPTTIDLIGPLLSALQDPARISAIVDPARLSALLNPSRVSDVEPN